MIFSSRRRICSRSRQCSGPAEKRAAGESSFSRALQGRRYQPFARAVRSYSMTWRFFASGHQPLRAEAHSGCLTGKRGASPPGLQRRLTPFRLSPDAAGPTTLLGFSSVSSEASPPFIKDADRVKSVLTFMVLCRSVAQAMGAARHPNLHRAPRSARRWPSSAEF